MSEHRAASGEQKSRCIFALACCLLLACSLSDAYAPGKFYSQGHTKEKVIALTFDDGPGVFTPKILEYLKAHHIRATFFIEGDQVSAYPQFVREVHDAGHELGNHTFSHLNFHRVKNQPAVLFVKELESTEEALRKALSDPHFKTRVVRMPYGAYGKFDRDWLIPILQERGYALVHWSFGEDWLLQLTPQKMAADYIKNAGPGAIFLMHDGGRHREKTFEALQIIVPALEQKGYRFVAADDLLKE
jgi:peptidoglycan/xylan/chitin deacetylase (PgdA/CDA1 family)